MLWSLKHTVRHDFNLGLSLRELQDSRCFVEEVSTQNMIPELNGKAVSVDGDVVLADQLVKGAESLVEVEDQLVKGAESLVEVEDQLVKGAESLVEVEAVPGPDDDVVEFELEKKVLEENVNEHINIADVQEQSVEFLEAPIIHRRVVAAPRVPGEGEVQLLASDLLPPRQETRPESPKQTKTYQVAVRQKLWGGEFPFADGIRYLARPTTSELHRRVVSALMRLPDVWWTDGDKREFIETQKQRAEFPEFAVSDLPKLGFAYTVMVWGEKFSKYIPNFVKRFGETVKRQNLLVFAMDEVAFQECEKAYRHLASSDVGGGGSSSSFTSGTGAANDEFLSAVASAQARSAAPACVYGAGTRTIVSKFTIPFLLAKYGVDSLWIDFDVYFVQDPTPHLFDAARNVGTAMNKNDHDHHIIPSTVVVDDGTGSKPQTSNLEILITGSFASHCICNGIVYFRATDNVIQWLIDVINWMYSHPYEHDQKCFAHWLDHTERVTFRPLPRSSTGNVPRWALLESVQKFVTAAVVEGNGWMGSLEKIVLFHWLHGDSDGAGTSGEWLRSSDFYKKYLQGLVLEEDAGGVGGGGAPGGGDHPLVTMMDIFFGDNPKLSSEEMKTRALEGSQQFERKMLLTETQHCGVMAELVSEHTELKENLADKDKLIL
eukprot:g15273.t1